MLEGYTVLVQRAAHRLERHGQPRRLAYGGLGAILRGPSRTDIQRIEREDEPRRVSLEVLLRGTCDRTRLLDLVQNFTLRSEHKTGLVKIVGQNHQFLGVNNAIASMPGQCSKKNASIMPRIVAFTARPSASVSTATDLKPGCFARIRTPYRRS